jgi:hypothetical protein
MTPARGQRVEGLVQVLILLTIGGMAAAASFTHVHNVAAAHGQPGWLAWADAVVLELMSIATGLEIRRRHRAGRPAGFVLGVLIAAVTLSLSAQVVEAERSVIGWLAAATPALGFLALVKIVLTRTPAGTGPSPLDVLVPAGTGERGRPVPAQDGGEDGQDDGDDGQAVSVDLLDQARTVAATYRAEHGRDITRDELRAALRVSNGTATELLRTVKQHNRTALVPVPADAFARPNGTTVHSAADTGGDK